MVLNVVRQALKETFCICGSINITKHYETVVHMFWKCATLNGMMHQLSCNVAFANAALRPRDDGSSQNAPNISRADFLIFGGSKLELLEIPSNVRFWLKAGN